MEGKSTKDMDNHKMPPIQYAKESNPVRMPQSKAPYTARNSRSQGLQRTMEGKSMKVMSNTEMPAIQWAKA
jgi:hypothetical protein